MKIAELLRGLMHLFFPETCSVCGRALQHGEEVLCLYCESELPRTRYYDRPNNKVEQVLWGRVQFQAATSFLFFAKKGMVQKMIHLLKYKDRKDVGERLGWYYGYELKSSNRFKDVDLIIPVPIHPRKLKVRGYNQSECIGKGMMAGLNVEMLSDVVVKAKHNASQTRKNRIERWRNAEDVFMLNNPERLKGKHVLVVDDVITTGATIEAVVECLMQVGDIKISIAALTFPM